MIVTLLESIHMAKRVRVMPKGQLAAHVSRGNNIVTILLLLYDYFYYLRACLERERVRKKVEES